LRQLVKKAFRPACTGSRAITHAPHEGGADGANLRKIRSSQLRERFLKDDTPRRRAIFLNDLYKNRIQPYKSQIYGAFACNDFAVDHSRFKVRLRADDDLVKWPPLLD
jgi:hypothetical protein